MWVLEIGLEGLLSKAVYENTNLPLSPLYLTASGLLYLSLLSRRTSESWFVVGHSD